MTGPVAIAVVVKAPVPGRVKTRMQPELSPEQAVAVAAAMLRDVTSAAQDAAAEVWWSYTGDRTVLDGLRPPGVRMLAQVGADLAQRLAHAHHTLHTSGARRVVLVGADCPTVDAGALREAVDLLDTHDVVVGPAVDGGYTLLGTAVCAPSLLSAVRMSTATTGADTIREAARLGLATAVMDARPDVDTVDDLRSALADGWLDRSPCTRAVAERVLSTTA